MRMVVVVAMVMNMLYGSVSCRETEPTTYVKALKLAEVMLCIRVSRVAATLPYRKNLEVTNIYTGSLGRLPGGGALSSDLD